MFVSFLIFAGVLAVLATMYASMRLVYAVFSCCDFSTAIARTPSDTGFAGKVVWITGASSGIGRALALAFGRHGAKLILTARDKNALEEVKREIQAFRESKGVGCDGADHVLVLPADMSDLDAIHALVNKAEEWSNHLDILVNNAGVSQRSTHMQAGFDVLEKLIKLNFLSKVKLTKSALPLLERSTDAVVVNTSSVAGKMGVPLRTAYCGSMHAIQGWFDSFRCEEYARGTGIRVVNICAGSIKTNVAKNALTENAQTARGESDPNIDNGLDPGYLADRVLAAVYDGNRSCISEIWVCPSKELAFLYLGQYFPDMAKILIRRLAKNYVAETLGSVSEGKKEK